MPNTNMFSIKDIISISLQVDLGSAHPIHVPTQPETARPCRRRRRRNRTNDIRNENVTRMDVNHENVEFVAPEVLDEAALENLSIVSSCAEATDEVQIEANSTLPTTSDTTIGTDDVISGQPTFDAIMPSFQPSQTLQPIDLPPPQPPFRCCPCCSTPYSSGRNCPAGM